MVGGDEKHLAGVFPLLLHGRRARAPIVDLHDLVVRRVRGGLESAGPGGPGIAVETALRVPPSIPARPVRLVHGHVVLRLDEEVELASPGAEAQVQREAVELDVPDPVVAKTGDDSQVDVPLVFGDELRHVTLRKGQVIEVDGQTGTIW